MRANGSRRISNVSVEEELEFGRAPCVKLCRDGAQQRAAGDYGSPYAGNCVSWVCGGFLRAEQWRVVGLAWIRERRLISAVVGVMEG